MSNVELFFHDCSIRGYHIYRSVCELGVGDILDCAVENSNKFDQFAVAVSSNGKTVGHVPREHSRVCFFLERGGKIQVVVTGKHFNRGFGLEVPAQFIFFGERDVS